MQIDILTLEKTVLVSLIDNYELIDSVIDYLNFDDFYDIGHQEVYKAILHLFHSDMPIDETFIRKFADTKKLTESNLISILAVTPILKIEHYAREIKELSKKRKLDHLANVIKKETQTENTLSEDIIFQIQTNIDHIDDVNKDVHEHKSIDLIEKIKFDMENKDNKDKEVFNTGLTKLDGLLEGIDDGELVIIAARPSMGKTSLISTICIETLKQGRGVLVESLEMDATKIMRRLLSTKSEEYLSDIKKGVVRSPKKFQEAMEFFNTDDLVIHDESYINLYQLQSKIKRVLRKNPNIKNVFIDHTGKIKLEGKTREDIEIGYITNTLKKIAREHNIRVFLLQQLNRSVESRDNKRPTLSDLKNSGNIEEDADIVLGLYRDSYYKTKDKDEQEKDLEESEIIILKNRDGRLGTAKVYFERKTSSFRNNMFNENMEEQIKQEFKNIFMQDS